jgi:hypothetical protein
MMAVGGGADWQAESNRTGNARTATFTLPGVSIGAAAETRS